MTQRRRQSGQGIYLPPELLLLRHTAFDQRCEGDRLAPLEIWPPINVNSVGENLQSRHRARSAVSFALSPAKRSGRAAGSSPKRRMRWSSSWSTSRGAISASTIVSPRLSQCWNRFCSLTPPCTWQRNCVCVIRPASKSRNRRAGKRTVRSEPIFEVTDIPTYHPLLAGAYAPC